MKIDAKKMEMKIFLEPFFLSVFLGHTKTHIELASDIAIKSKKKRKKVLWSVFGVGQQKEPQMQKKKEQTKEERTTRQTILDTLLNFFSSWKEPQMAGKKIAIDVNVVVFFRLEDLSFSLLKSVLF